MILRTGALVPDVIRQQSLWVNNLVPIDHAGCTLIHFWAMSCPACHANMPQLQKLRDDYAYKGLNIIAVHMPLGEFDLDTEHLLQVITELGVTEPCAMDNDHRIGDAFGVNARPAYYLFDTEGKLCRRALGNFGVRMIEQALIQLFHNSRGEKL